MHAHAHSSASARARTHTDTHTQTHFIYMSLQESQKNRANSHTTEQVTLVAPGFVFLHGGRNEPQKTTKQIFKKKNHPWDLGASLSLFPISSSDFKSALASSWRRILCSSFEIFIVSLIKGPRNTQQGRGTKVRRERGA